MRSAKQKAERILELDKKVLLNQTIDKRKSEMAYLAPAVAKAYLEAVELLNEFMWVTDINDNTDVLYNKTKAYLKQHGGDDGA